MVISSKLISFTFKNIKSVSHPVTIQFLKKTLDNEAFEESNIKILYGPNGAGKTAAVLGLYFFKKIATDSRALECRPFVEKIINSFNSNGDKIVLDVSFVCAEDEKSNIRVNHSIELNVDKKKNTVSISKEVIRKETARGDLSTILFSVENGVLNHSHYDSLKSLFLNRLDNCSITARTMTLLDKFFVEDNGSAVIIPEGRELLASCLFTSSMVVFFGSEENVLYKPYRASSRLTKEELESACDNTNAQSDFNYLTRVTYENYQSYVSHIECVKRFVKLFKPNLKDIEIDKRDLRDLYWINLTFVYDDGTRVDFSEESTGIKKIVSLSNALEAASEGAVVIIDEIDSGILDKAISEIVSYVKQYTKGQLFLTTHHVGLMNIVKELKHSIDFLSSDGVLTKWINNANYNPEKVFLNGGIPHIPLNISSLDFVDVFNKEEERNEQ